MRRFAIAVVIATGFGLFAGAGAASAADGCGYGPGGYYCQPGARPGVPYDDGDYRYRRHYYGGDPYYGHRRYRSYDPGPEIAAGVIGAIGGAIIAQQRYQRRAKHRRR